MINTFECMKAKTLCIFPYFSFYEQLKNVMLSCVENEKNCVTLGPGLDVTKLEYSLRLKIERNNRLLVDTCPQAANLCALF